MSGTSTAVREDGQLAAEKLAAKAHAGVDKIADKGARAEEKARTVARKAGARADEISEEAAAVANEAVATTRKSIENNPLMAAGAAFAAGFLLSALLRR